MNRFLALQSIAALILGLGVAGASAAIVPTDLNYVGAYRPSQAIDGYAGRSGVAYYDDPTNGDVLYGAADDLVFADAIPTPLLPSTVGWGNINVAGNLIAKTDIDPSGGNWAGQGLRIRDDGSGSPDINIYGPGYNGVWGSANIDLTGAARKGDSGSHITGSATHDIPTGYVEYVVGDSSKNAYDTLVCGSRYGLRIDLTAPQLGDGSSIPLQVVQSNKAGAASKWPSVYAPQDVEWVQEDGDDWADAHIVMLEYDGDNEQWRITFYDPTKMADAGDTPGDEELVDDLGHIIVMEDIPGFAHSAGFDSTSGEKMSGMTYDPVKKLLYVNEVSDDSGAEDGETNHIIHVFNVVPEPATLGLLTLGIAVMRLRRRRRRLT